MRRLLTAAAVALIMSGVLLGGEPVSQAASSIHFDMPGITLGPDGNVWFVDGFRGHVGRITPAGKITLFTLPSSFQGLSLAAGPGKSVYVSTGTGVLFRVTPDGRMSRLQVSSHLSTGKITAGPNGTLWFTYSTGLGELNAHLVYTQHTLPHSFATLHPSSVAVTRYGTPWFSDNSRLVRFAGAHQLNVFTVSSTGGNIGSVAVGPDGNLWFTVLPGQVGRSTPTGQMKLYTLPPKGSYPTDITSGPRGSLWVARQGLQSTNDGKTYTTVFPPTIDQVTLAGTIAVHPIPTSLGGATVLSAITAGADGNLWFPELMTDSSGAIVSASVDRMTPTGRFTRFLLPGFHQLPPAPSPTTVPAPAGKIPIQVTLTSPIARSAVETIRVVSIPSAHVLLEVLYPGSGGFKKRGTIGSDGTWVHSWTVNAVNVGTATVQLTLTAGSGTRHFTKHFEVT
jgi:hypothetical protein